MTPEEVLKNLESKFQGLQEELKTAQEKAASKDEIKRLHDEIAKSGQAVEDFIAAQQSKVRKSLEQEVCDFIAEKADEIQSIYKQGNGVLEFVPKVVGAITTGSGTDAETPDPNMNTNLGSFNLRNDNWLMGLMNVGSTGKSTYSYTELVPKEGDYNFVAEAGTKPQIDFSWSNRYPEPKKIAAHEVLTEEAVTDVVRLQGAAREFLQKKHDLFKVNALFFATGVGALPTGATVYGRTFVAGSMANALPINTVNFMDVVNAIITDIYTTQNYTDEAHYMPNIVMINPVDFFLNLVAAKDANGLPLYPQAGLFNRVTIGGVSIVPWIKIPAGKIFAADMTKYNVLNYVPFSIRIGWINDQFITNQFTMVGESRFFQFVKNLDQAAFVYDDIATVWAAIEADV